MLTTSYGLNWGKHSNQNSVILTFRITLSVNHTIYINTQLAILIAIAAAEWPTLFNMELN